MQYTDHTLNQVVSCLAEELQSHWATNGKRRLGPADEDAFRASLSHIIIDAMQAYNPSSEKSMASIHKSSGHYSQGRYWSAPYGYKIHIGRSYDGLCGLGYIQECKKGVYTDYARLLTRYRATDKLVAMFDEDMIEDLHVILRPRTNSETIRLNITQEDGYKMLVDYQDTEETVAMREDMAIINKCLSKSWVDLELDEDQMRDMKLRMLPEAQDRRSLNDNDGILRLQDRTLYRVFNDEGFSTNGRLYGSWWQNIPKDYRPYIIIDGKRTIELDYSGLHPSLIYAMCGEKLNGDPYELLVGNQFRSRRKEFRKVVKRAFNAMLNAGHELMREPTGTGLSQFNLSWKELKEAIIAHHAPIANKFFTATGAQLQLIDSKVAIAVLKHFAEMGVAVLPVHDSFIMHQGYQSELKEVMRKALRRETGISVPVKLTEREHMPARVLPADDDIEALLLGDRHDRRLRRFRDGIVLF